MLRPSRKPQQGTQHRVRDKQKAESCIRELRASVSRGRSHLHGSSPHLHTGANDLHSGALTAGAEHKDRTDTHTRKTTINTEWHITLPPLR